MVKNSNFEISQKSFSIVVVLLILVLGVSYLNNSSDSEDMSGYVTIEDPVLSNANANTIQYQTCKDSDGNDRFVLGKVTVAGYTAGYINSFTDACMGGGTNKLKEYSCSSWRNSGGVSYKSAMLTIYDCSYGCSNGVCLRAPTGVSTPSCVSSTCSGLGKSCGAFSDNCGGTLNCGTCLSSQTCTNGTCVATVTTSTTPVSTPSTIDPVLTNANANTIQYKSCKDSDGKDRFTLGKVTAVTFAGGVASFTDACMGAGTNKLKEFSCSSWRGGYKNAMLTVYDCTYGCSNGACIKAPATPATPGSAAPLCTDTDNGQNINVKGSATGYNNNVERQIYTLIDRCKDQNTVYEAFCEKEYVNGNFHTCPAGTTCTDGACISIICTDSDGLNLGNKGTAVVTQNGVPLSGKSAEDYCSGADIMEYICKNNDALGVSFKCPNGCSNGACTL